MRFGGLSRWPGEISMNPAARLRPPPVSVFAGPEETGILARQPIRGDARFGQNPPASAH